MAVTKWPQVEEQLILVEKWCRDGLSEKQIAKNLRISKTTMEDFKKRYPVFLAALKRGKQPFIAEVENALSKRALGFEYEETKTYIKFEKGKEVKYQEKTKKYYPPDVAACIILLKNKDKDEDGKAQWGDNPMKIDMDREMAEFKKEMERLKSF